MNFLSFLNKGRRAENKPSKATYNAAPASRAERSASSGSKSTRSGSKGKQVSRHASKAAKVPSAIQTQSIYVQAAHNWMHALNTHVPKDPQAFLDRIISCYEHPDTPVILEDGETHKAQDGAGLFHATHLSFPDFVMNYGKVVEDISNDEITVEIHSMFATGTFTGTPYTILPGVLPEIEPNGKFTQNDEQLIILTMNKEAKITKCQVVAHGVATGFAGFYVAAGGEISFLMDG